MKNCYNCVHKSDIDNLVIFVRKATLDEALEKIKLMQEIEMIGRTGISDAIKIIEEMIKETSNEKTN